ncbi:MAG: PAS domain S-box protein [Phormidesmis sp.]
MNRRRTLPLRTIILIPFILQLLTTVGVISWIFFRSERDAVYKLAGQLREEVSQRVEIRLNSYLSAPLTINQITANAIELDQLSIEDFSTLQKHFWQQSILFPDVSYLYFGRSDGEYTAVYANSLGERFYESTDGNGRLNINEIGQKGELGPQASTRRSPYDPRIRPWYIGALDANGPVWINMYNWSAVNRLGITLSQPYYDGAGTLEGVLSVDLSQDRINDFLQSLKLSASTRVFLIEQTGTLVASSSSQRPFLMVDGLRTRVDAVDFLDPLIQETAQYIEQNYNNQLTQTKRVEIKGTESDHNFVQITPLKDRYGLDWLLVVVVPETDFIAPIRAAEQTTLRLCLIALGLSVLFAIWFAGRLSKPILRLAVASKTLSHASQQQFTNQPSVPFFQKSAIREINTLSTSFKEMSKQLAVSYSQLEEYSQSLEVKVLERTQALEKESQERQQSEATLQTLVTNIPGTVYRCLANDTWNMLFISDSILDISGYPASDFIDDKVRKFGDIVYPGDLKATAEAIETAVSRQEPYLIEYRIIDVTGQIRWVYDKGRGVCDREGKLLHLEGVFIDITPQKHAEEAMFESEERYHSLFEDAPIALWEEDFSAVKRYLEEKKILNEVNDFEAYFKAHPDTVQQCIKRVKILDVNQATLQLFEAEEKEDILKRLINPTHPSVTEGFQKELTSLCRGETSFEAELANYTLTGKKKHVIFKEFITPGHEEDWSRALISIIDITDRIEAQAQLATSEAKYRTLNESTQDAVMLINSQGFIDCNPATLAIFGCQEKSEFAGKTPADFSPVKQPDGRSSARAIKATIAKAIRAGTYNFEWTHRRKDVTLFPAEVWLTSMEIDSKGVVQAVVRDITRRKRVESEVLKAKETAEIANKAKSEFLANMSHELRSPLNAILGFSELMTHSTLLPKEHQDDVTIINRSGEYLLSLINDVLDMSKIEAGRTVLSPIDFDLHSLLEDLHGMFKLKAEEKQLQLSLNRTPDLPKYIYTDQAKVRQVLINLLNNAIKFTQQGNVTLNVREQLQETDQDIITETAVPSAKPLALHFEITDTGVGIEPDEVDTIFEPFVQSKSGISSQEGTGLGLPISRQFVQLMGGDIEITSRTATPTAEISKTETFGTTVRFCIQAQEGNKDNIVSTGIQRKIIGLRPGHPHYRLLIVDDKAPNRQLLVKLLSPLGFALKEATNGKEATEVVASWQPHLIWMDLRMPIMDGFEATARIRQHSQTTLEQATLEQSALEQTALKTGSSDNTAIIQPKIIALSATSYQTDRIAAQKAGCDDFIRKPFNNSDIYDATAKYLNLRYRYQSETDSLGPDTEENANIAANISIDTAALSTLAPQLVTDLEAATRRLQWKTIFHIIEQIRHEDAELARALSATVHNFQYAQVLDAIETASKS